MKISLFFGETDFTIGFAALIFPIQCRTFVAVWLLQISDFYEKLHFTMDIFKFWVARGWRFKILDQSTKKHSLPYAISGRIKRLAYVLVALFWHYTAPRKKVRENAHWKLESCITMRRYRAAVIHSLYIKTNWLHLYLLPHPVATTCLHWLFNQSLVFVELMNLI